MGEKKPAGRLLLFLHTAAAQNSQARAAKHRLLLLLDALLLHHLHLLHLHLLHLHLLLHLHRVGAWVSSHNDGLLAVHGLLTVHGLPNHDGLTGINLHNWLLEVFFSREKTKRTILDRVCNKVQKLLAAVEFQFFTLEQNSVCATTLSWTRSNSSVETTSLELFQHVRLKSRQFLAFDVLVLGLLAQLLNGSEFFLFFSSQLLSLLLGQRNGIVAFIPSSERNSVDGDNHSLNKSLGSDKFVSRSAVGSVDDTGLASSSFRPPGEVSGIQTQSTILEISTTATDSVNTSSTNLSVGRRTTEFELTLLSHLHTLSARGTALVHRVARNTHLDGLTDY